MRGFDAYDELDEDDELTLDDAEGTWYGDNSTVVCAFGFGDHNGFCNKAVVGCRIAGCDLADE